jgi:trehalose synthase
MIPLPAIVDEREAGAGPGSPILSPDGDGGILHVTPSVRGEPAAIVRPALERAREADREARWVTVTGKGAFQAVGERLSAGLQGLETDEGGLGEAEQHTYTSVLRVGAEMLAEIASSFELAFVHDPPTAGLCRPLKESGATVVWACHVSISEANETARAAWAFLAPHLEAADSLVFLRPGAIPDDVGGPRSWRTLNLQRRY